MSPRRHLKAPTIAALLAAAGAVSACGGERTAEAETDTSEVEVSTTLPEGALPQAELERQAQEAAQAASASPPATLVVPAQPGTGSPPPSTANLEATPSTTSAPPQPAGTVAPN